MDTDVYMRLPEGCHVLTDVTIELGKSIHGIKQGGRQWSRLLCRTLLEDVGMVQCEADPCVFKMGDAGDVRVILVVHVDDILISGTEGNVQKVGKLLNDKFPTNNLGEFTWYMGCAVDRDWDRGTLSVTQTTSTDMLLKRF
ncbi:unnamed protein product, partial [Sphacelaria rigidula]